MRSPKLALAAACAFLTVTAPAQAIVGGTDAAPGEFPSVAEITFGAFGCTGTLIAPNKVLSAGHCGSITGGTAFSSPAAWPAALVDVRIGSVTPGAGERVAVSSVTVHPSYFLTDGYDIAILHLRTSSTKTPTKVAGAGSAALWAPGTALTIAGFGNTSEGGSPPDTLQKASVPRRTDAYCAERNSGYDVATMLCAGYDEGGVDTCQGDSGGPAFAGTGTARRVVGATSFGTGCARPDEPGYYARVADTTLREWIRGQAPAGVE